MSFARASATALLLLVPALALGARWSEPEAMGLVTEAAIDEISGLAAARRHPGLLVRWPIKRFCKRLLLPPFG